MRRVLNGAAKLHGTSLNKSLFTDPNQLQNLINVLLRFRQHQFAGQISKAYSSKWVSMAVTSQHCGSFWREDPTTIVIVYQYTCHIFGAKNSPTCANYNNDTLFVSRGNSSTINKSLTQRFVLSLVSEVYDPSGTIYCWCSISTNGDLACPREAFGMKGYLKTK